MKLFILSFLVALSSLGAIAQSNNLVDTMPRTSTLNKFDTKGDRQGTWYFSYPEGLGNIAYSEFGNFDHGRKTGAWYKVNKDGDLLAIENYRNNVFNGEVKYYDNGLLYCVGHYRGLNPDNAFDTIIVVEPESGKNLTRIIPADRGFLKHGSWKYYDPISGRLTKEEEYQVDNLIYQRAYLMSKKDSLNLLRRQKNLPHNKKVKYRAAPNNTLSILK